MRSPHFCLGLALVLTTALPFRFPVAVAVAAEPGGLAPGSPAAVEEAKRHFERALAAYHEGAYRVAITELERALALDPAGKDLVFNLGLVYEKLGDVDRAIEQFERYVSMESDPEEAERARSIVRRLVGARTEMGQKQPAPPPRPAEPEPPAAPPAERERGRLDGWVIAAGGVAAAATLVGTVFGLRALGLRPSSTDATGDGTSAQDLEQQAREAHDLAVIADVAFGVALASAGAGAALYFLRDAQPASAGQFGARLEVRF